MFSYRGFLIVRWDMSIEILEIAVARVEKTSGEEGADLELDLERVELGI